MKIIGLFSKLLNDCYFILFVLNNLYLRPWLDIYDRESVCYSIFPKHYMFVISGNILLSSIYEYLTVWLKMNVLKSDILYFNHHKEILFLQTGV